jgi:hypothetical protein
MLAARRAPPRIGSRGRDGNALAVKAWARSHPVGRMVGHPSVVAEAGQAHDVHPRLVTRSGLALITYSRTRVYIDRDAWEMLPDDGVLLIQIRHPEERRTSSFALTAEEMASVFGEVRSTRSWDEARCYHFPKAPLAVASFRVATPRDGR